MSVKYKLSKELFPHVTHEWRPSSTKSATLPPLSELPPSRACRSCRRHLVRSHAPIMRSKTLTGCLIKLPRMPGPRCIYWSLRASRRLRIWACASPGRAHRLRGSNASTPQRPRLRLWSRPLRSSSFYVSHLCCLITLNRSPHLINTM